MARGGTEAGTQDGQCGHSGWSEAPESSTRVYVLIKLLYNELRRTLGITFVLGIILYLKSVWSSLEVQVHSLFSTKIFSLFWYKSCWESTQEHVTSPNWVMLLSTQRTNDQSVNSASCLVSEEPGIIGRNFSAWWTLHFMLHFLVHRFLPLFSLIHSFLWPPAFPHPILYLKARIQAQYMLFLTKTKSKTWTDILLLLMQFLSNIHCCFSPCNRHWGVSFTRFWDCAQPVSPLSFPLLSKMGWHLA